MSEPLPATVIPAMGAGFRRRRAAKAIALAAIIFAGGGATGWGVAILHRPPPPLFGEAPPPRVNDMVTRLRDELLLSDDQAKQVREIYQQRDDALQAIRQKMGPQLKSQYDKLNEQMKQILNPVQFQKWHERFEDVRSRMLPPPRRGPGGPGGPEGGFGPGRGPRPDGGFPPPPPPGGGPPNDGPPHDGPPRDGPPPL